MLLNRSDKITITTVKQTKSAMYPTCHLCFIEDQLGRACYTSVMALCFIGNEAITQDVTLSMCQLMAVIEGMSSG